ncbi:MAG: hypothetical protein E1N59_539 [Puniceicoccaceae bacterium 5H]|nr:MAG: hypothetical protein E1N59_539 [Puniceicoccaceae bacterium 5H]
MRNPILPAALIVLSLVLAAFAWYQHQEIQRLETELAQATPEQLQLAAAPETQPLAQKVDELQRQLKQAQADAEEARQATASPEPAPITNRQTEDDSNMLKDMADLVRDNPAMNEMVTTQQRATLEYMYRNLADGYNFTPEEKAYFYDLLLARQMQRVNFGLMAMRGSMTDEERQAAIAEVEAADQQLRSEMEAFLNNDTDWQRFERFENTLGIRSELDSFSKSVAGSEPLSADVYEQLVDTIQQERERYPFSHNFDQGGDGGMDLSQLNETAINEHIDELRQSNAIIQNAVASYLTPAQLAAFRQNQEQMLTMQAASLRMAAQMFARQSNEQQ